MKQLSSILVLVCGLMTGEQCLSGDFDSPVDLKRVDSGNYYLSATVDNTITGDFLVDTGSGYLTLTSRTLRLLQRDHRLERLREITGVMADGSRRSVVVYLVRSLKLGANCELRNVEAAVIPGATRNILGLSALRKAAPFAVHTNPDKIMLSNCAPEPSAGLPLAVAP